MSWNDEIKLFDSVIGFEHKNEPTKIKNDDGEYAIEYVGGIKSTIIPDIVEPIKHKECDPRWFTNFNHKLLNKIKDYKRLNS